MLIEQATLIQGFPAVMNKSLRVLIVGSSEDDARLLLRELRRGGYDPVFERVDAPAAMRAALERAGRSEEHTSELQSRYISYAVFCLQKKNIEVAKYEQLVEGAPTNGRCVSPHRD